MKAQTHSTPCADYVSPFKVSSQTPGEQDVGLAPQDADADLEQHIRDCGRDRVSVNLHALTDEQLQDHIEACAARLKAAHDRWEETGCFGDAADRLRAWQDERDALLERGKRPAIVAAMERARGLG